ncbi:MAG: hypothetical protein ACW96N_00460 [Candidatus Thorarchaeota archaeon]|jgi:vacuolar-type H+-ATPase subunit E/Vma4
MNEKTLKEKVQADKTYQHAIASAPEEDRENIVKTVMHVVEQFEQVNNLLREVLADPEKAQQMRDMIEAAAKKNKKS